MRRDDAALDVPVPADLPFPMTYQVDMETTDVSNLSVSDSKSFLALPSDAVIGLPPIRSAKPGAAMPIRAIVTDADGKAVAGRAVHLELQKMTYTSATQEEEGGENAAAVDQVRRPCRRADVSSPAKPVTAQLTPSDVGPYRVVANFAGRARRRRGKRDADPGLRLRRRRGRLGTCTIPMPSRSSSIRSSTRSATRQRADRIAVRPRRRLPRGRAQRRHLSHDAARRRRRRSASRSR